MWPSSPGSATSFLHEAEVPGFIDPVYAATRAGDVGEPPACLLHPCWAERSDTMKQKLSLVVALALSSALLAGCDRPAGDAASGGTSSGSSASGSSSGSAGAGGTAGQSSQPKKSTAPSGAGGTSSGGAQTQGAARAR